MQASIQAKLGTEAVPQQLRLVQKLQARLSDEVSILREANDYHAVTGLEVVYRGADLLHDAHGLVADAVVGPRNKAVVYVEVRATDSRSSDAHQGVFRLEDLGAGDDVHAHVADCPLPLDGSHETGFRRVRHAGRCSVPGPEWMIISENDCRGL